MKILQYFLIQILFVSSFHLFATTIPIECKYYPLQIGNIWEYQLGDSTDKTILRFSIISQTLINGVEFYKTKQEWLKADSLLYTQDYFQTVENGFVITTMNREKPAFQIVQQCDATLRFNELLAKKFSISMTEEQLEELHSLRSSFTFTELNSGTSPTWEFRSKREVSKFVENVGLVYLKNENVTLHLLSATIQKKVFKLLK